MNVHSTRQLLIGLVVASALGIAAACSGTSPSMNPTSPSVTAGASGASFSPNPTEPPTVCTLPPPWETDSEGNCDCRPPNIFDPATKSCNFPPPPTGKEGCTPGYWKANANNRGASDWPAPYTPLSTLETVFDVPDSLGIDSDTLLTALGYGGGSGVAGGARILLRAAAAAVLNAQSSGVAYPLTTAQVIAQVNAALASGNRDTMIALAGMLDADNNLGCPLNNSGS